MGYDSCYPSTYMGHLNNECPSTCPVFCPENEIQCPGGVDPHTGNILF